MGDIFLLTFPFIERCYQPRRVNCPRCGVRVEDFPWAEPWARVTTALFNAVAVLARELSWQGTAREYGLNWKSVATIVKRAVVIRAGWPAAANPGLACQIQKSPGIQGIEEVVRGAGTSKSESAAWSSLPYRTR
jgi:hypothetical protein